MEFSVEITSAALADAEAYVNFIRADRGEPLAAEQWWNGLIDQIRSLETLPRRCSIIPEQKYFEQEMRHLIYASHRIIFSLDEHTATILRIYHGARKSIHAIG
ncbi:MAG: type II toxin-antitoxin system RelE/ParE family toxin [Acidobacteriaceae bacterium]